MQWLNVLAVSLFVSSNQAISFSVVAKCAGRQFVSSYQAISFSAVAKCAGRQSVCSVTSCCSCMSSPGRATGDFEDGRQRRSRLLTGVNSRWTHMVSQRSAKTRYTTLQLQIYYATDIQDQIYYTTTTDILHYRYTRPDILHYKTDQE